MSEKGEYRGIHAALLDDESFQTLSVDARALFFVLKLKLGMAGIDVFYPEMLPRYSGVPMERIQPAVDELQAGDWLRIERNVYWLRNGLRFDPSNPLGSPNQRKGISAHLKSLPKLAIVEEFARYYELVQVTPPAPDSGKGSPKGSERGSRTLSKHGRRKTETETETTTPPGGSDGCAAAAPDLVEVGSVDELEDPGVPVLPLHPVASPDEVPFAGRDWTGHVNGGQVLAEWIRRQPVRPSDADCARFGKACRRLAGAHTTGTLALAFIGMGQLWPHAPPKSEPWDPLDLERKFVKAAAAAANHPALRELREQAEFDAQFNAALEAGGAFG